MNFRRMRVCCLLLALLTLGTLTACTKYTDPEQLPILGETAGEIESEWSEDSSQETAAGTQAPQTSTESETTKGQETTAAPETTTESETTAEPETTEPDTTEGQGTTEDVQAPDEQGSIVTPGAVGYTYPELQEDLAALAATYIDAFSYRSIGKSVDGREIYACTVGNPNAERKLLLTGGIHGKEYLSSLLVMTQVEYYLANREGGSYNGLSYAELLDTYTVYVLPMINPDGIMLALEGISSMQTPEVRAKVEKIYADNLRDGLTGASDIDVYLAYNWKANANGVDLNRNFALSNWSEVKTGIAAPCYRNYKGPKAASEPETQAVSAYVEGLGEIEALLSYHTAGQVVYWDCGMTGGVRLETYDLAKNICDHTGYQLIYDEHLDASLNDWITLEKGVPSVTIEIANVVYPMPTSELEAAFAQTKQLWVVAAQTFG